MQGSGTLADPYEISTPQDVQDISCFTNESTHIYFDVVNDIDMSTTVNWNGGLGFNPIGQSSSLSSTTFMGNIDGNDHTISNMTINRSSLQKVGLFGFLPGGTTVRDLKIDGWSLDGGVYVGAIVGKQLEDFRYQRIKITNSSFTSHGQSSFGCRVGGVVGFLWDSPSQVGEFQEIAVEDCDFVGSTYANSTGLNCLGSMVGRWVGGATYPSYGSSAKNWRAVGNSFTANSSRTRACGLGYGFQYLTIRDSYVSNINFSTGTAFDYQDPLTYASGQQSYSDLYYDTTYNSTTHITATGLTSTQMTESSNFSGWDKSEWLWTSSVNSGYPSLATFYSYILPFVAQSSAGSLNPTIEIQSLGILGSTADAIGTLSISDWLGATKFALTETARITQISAGLNTNFNHYVKFAIYSSDLNLLAETAESSIINSSGDYTLSIVSSDQPTIEAGDYWLAALGTKDLTNDFFDISIDVNSTTGESLSKSYSVSSGFSFPASISSYSTASRTLRIWSDYESTSLGTWTYPNTAESLSQSLDSTWVTEDNITIQTLTADNINNSLNPTLDLQYGNDITTETPESQSVSLDPVVGIIINVDIQANTPESISQSLISNLEIDSTLISETPITITQSINPDLNLVSTFKMDTAESQSVGLNPNTATIVYIDAHTAESVNETLVSNLDIETDKTVTTQTAESNSNTLQARIEGDAEMSALTPISISEAHQPVASSSIPLEVDSIAYINQTIPLYNASKEKLEYNDLSDGSYTMGVNYQKDKIGVSRIWKIDLQYLRSSQYNEIESYLRSNLFGVTDFWLESFGGAPSITSISAIVEIENDERVHFGKDGVWEDKGHNLTLVIKEI